MLSLFFFLESMIVNTTLSQDAEYLGDIQEHRVGIDKSNIDFITTLLTSNLYSKPLESFLRETVANAYDSHVEAGSSEHILLLIEDTSYNTYRISIRDYGVGVSPERFETIYKNIGSSTKRQSNDYIGMFGIGRFSCLACADTAHITSYYNGTKYSYVMYKNGGGINIDRISETEGDFKTGLEVSIEKTIYSISNLITAINGVCLFDKLHISYKGESSLLKRHIESFNSRKIFNYKTFSSCSLLEKNKNYFRVGNVLYSNNDTRLSTKNGIIVNLPIGTVDITPNREELQFTSYTEKEIDSRITAVKQELQELLDTRVTGNLTLPAFAEGIALNSVFSFELCDDKGDPDTIRIDKGDVTLKLDNLTIDGEALPANYVEFLDVAKYVGIGKELTHKILPGKNYYYRRTPSTELKRLLLGNYDVMLKGDVITRQATFLYFTSSVINPTVILVHDGLKAWKQVIIDYIKKGYNPIKNVEECVDFTFKHIPMKTMLNSEVPDWFITEYKDAQKAKRKKADTSKVPVRSYHDNGYTLDYLDNLPKKGLVIYTNHIAGGEDSSLRQLSHFIKPLPSIAAIITVKAEYIKLLEQDCRFMKLENFMFLKNNVLGKLFTAKEILNNFHKRQAIYHPGTSVSALPLFSDFIAKYRNEHSALRYTSVNSTMHDLYNYYKDKGWLRNADISYYQISEEEGQALQYWEKLSMSKVEIVQAIAFKKHGRLQRIGLTPVKALKLI